MPDTTYYSGATTVLWAGRALDDALAAGDEVDVQAAVAELLRAAEARETAGGGVQGFESAPADRARAPTVDDSLAMVLTELDLGQALLAAGHDVGEEGAPQPPVPLGDTLDQLDSDARFITEAGDPATWGFTGGEYAGQPPLDAFRSRLDAAVDAIVSRTIGIGAAVMEGMAAIPLATVQPWAESAAILLDALPKGGPVVRAGLRAVRRAVAALERLVPDAIRSEVRKLADRWRGSWAGGGVEGATRALLGVGKVESAARQALAQRLDDARLRAGAGKLDELVARHDRTTQVVDRILRVLHALLGPLAAIFAAAAWLYGAAAVAYVAAAVAVLWFGRDCLDTGYVLDRIPGVQAILAEVAG